MKLRDYQQDAVNAAIAHMKKSTEPSLLELATGAGKSGSGKCQDETV